MFPFCTPWKHQKYFGFKRNISRKLVKYAKNPVMVFLDHKENLVFFGKRTTAISIYIVEEKANGKQNKKTSFTRVEYEISICS